jgi:hypothetical protein
VIKPHIWLFKIYRICDNFDMEGLTLNRYLSLNIEKIVQIFFYIQRLTDTTDKVELIKYLFFSDRINIRKHFSFISLDTYFALKRGPVASSSLYILNNNKEKLNKFITNDNSELRFLNNIEKINEKRLKIYHMDDDLLSNNEKGSIDKAIEIFQGKPLVELSHDYPEWKRYKEFFNEKPHSRKPIFIDDFFANPIVEDSPSINHCFNGKDPLYLDQEYLDEAKEFYFQSNRNVI